MSVALVDVAAMDTLLDGLLVLFSFVLFIFGFKCPRFDLLLVDMVYYDTMMSIVIYVELKFLYIRMLLELINQITMLIRHENYALRNVKNAKYYRV